MRATDHVLWPCKNYEYQRHFTNSLNPFSIILHTIACNTTAKSNKKCKKKICAILRKNAECTFRIVQQHLITPYHCDFMRNWAHCAQNTEYFEFEESSTFGLHWLELNECSMNRRQFWRILIQFTQPLNINRSKPKFVVIQHLYFCVRLCV